MWSASHWAGGGGEKARQAESYDGTVYAGCAVWHDWVVGMRDRKWRCIRCGEVAPGRDMVVVLAPISL